MKLREKEFILPKDDSQDNILKHISDKILQKLEPEELPVRMAVTKTDDKSFQCELGVLTGHKTIDAIAIEDSIFDFAKRPYENTSRFNAVFIVPTGIGAEIGGHSGDSGPTARLLSQVCDNLITHPNVGNAADINDLPDNSLYVEGSIITRLLMGTIGLKKVRANRLMLVMDKHPDQFFTDRTINAISAARAACGITCTGIVELPKNLSMRSAYSTSGRATGQIEHFETLCNTLKKYKHQYDAVAIASLIQVPDSYHRDYFNEKSDSMVNPWGGVEALLTHAVSLIFNIPSAHAPLMTSKEVYNLDIGIVDPRKSPETVSVSYLHSLLKGLHRSPQIIKNPSLAEDSQLITASDISCLVSPDGCLGLPHLAALEQGIPVISVRDNKNRMQNSLEELPFASGKLHIVDNYLEAVGMMAAIKAGVSRESFTRPIPYTRIFTS